MTIFGLKARNGADGAILGTGAAMQAVLGLYAIGVSRLDALLRAVLKAGAATDTRIASMQKPLAGAGARLSSKVKTARSMG